MKTKLFIFFFIVGSTLFGQNSSIQILSPTENSKINSGELVEIEWSWNQLQGVINIYISKDLLSSDELLTTINVAEQSYFWLVPEDFAAQNGTFSIIIVSADNDNVYDEITLRTSISSPEKLSIKIIKPGYLESFHVGDGVEIAWDGNLDQDIISIYYKLIHSDDWNHISKLAFIERSFIWYPPSSLVNNQEVEIAIQSDSDPHIWDKTTIKFIRRINISTNLDYTQAGKKFIVTKDEDNIREGPSTNHQILARTHKGDSFTIRGMDGGWVAIEYNGNIAYTHKSNGYIATPGSLSPWTFNISFFSVGYTIGGNSQFQHGYLIEGPSIRIHKIRIGYGAMDKENSYGINFGYYTSNIVNPKENYSEGGYVEYYRPYNSNTSFFDFGYMRQYLFGEFKMGYRLYLDGGEKISTPLSGLHLSISAALSLHIVD